VPDVITRRFNDNDTIKLILQYACALSSVLVSVPRVYNRARSLVFGINTEARSKDIFLSRPISILIISPGGLLVYCLLFAEIAHEFTVTLRSRHDGDYLVGEAISKIGSSCWIEITKSCWLPS